MGKKPQKTKEVWAAIAEAATTIDDEQQQQSHSNLQLQPQQVQVTRKRGRPRKIIDVKIESSEEEKPVLKEQPSEAESNKEEKQEDGITCMRVSTKQDEGVSEVPKEKGVPSRSRARRKSIPRKSSTQ